MDDQSRKILEGLRAIGVKAATFSGGAVTQVEFFPLTPSIPHLDYESLVPPATEEDNPPNEQPRAQYKPPPALAALLTKPSVS